MNTYKRIMILILVFVIAFSYPLSVSATDTTAVNVSDEDRKKFDLFFGEGNWTVNAEGYAECTDWDKSPSVAPTSKLDDFFATGFGVSGVLGKYGESGLVSGLRLKEWIDRNIDTEINVQKVMYDNNKEDYKVTVSKKAMEELQKNLYDYATPLQGYYLFSENTTRSAILDSFNLDKNKSEVYTPFYDFVHFRDNIVRVKMASYSSGYNSSPIIDACISLDSNCYVYIFQSGSSTYLGCVDSSLVDLKPAYINNEWSWQASFYEAGKGYHSKFKILDLSFMYSGSPLKVFYSKSDIQIYLNQLKGTSAQNIYLSNSFYNYSPTDYSFDMSTYNNTDWSTVNNNTYNEIVNNKNTYIENNTTISEDELQNIIDIAIKKVIDSNPTEPDNPDKPVDPDVPVDPDKPPFDDTKILEVLKSILSRTGNIDETVRQVVEQLLLIKNNFIEKTDSIILKMDEILEKLGGDSGGSLFDFIRELLAEFLGNVLSDLLNLFIGEDGIDGSILEPAKALASSAQARFPTCIPWDIVAIIGTFSAEPETPVFKLPFSIKSLGIEEEIVIDFGKAKSLAELSRTLIILSFLLFLLIQTRNLYGSLTGNK